MVEGSCWYEENSEFERVHFSTTLDKKLYEKLKSLRFYKSIKISDLVNKSVREKITQIEKDLGREIRVPYPLKIEDE